MYTITKPKVLINLCPDFWVSAMRLDFARNGVINRNQNVFITFQIYHVFIVQWQTAHLFRCPCPDYWLKSLLGMVLPIEN